MNNLQGTFRLSIVVAIVAGAYTAWSDYRLRTDQQLSNLEWISTLRCGAKTAPELLEQHKNVYGNYDLGKVGCADRQYLASSEEMKNAWSGKYDNELPLSLPPMFTAENTLGVAFVWFVLTNLAGFALLGLLSAYNWVVSGFMRKS